MSVSSFLEKEAETGMDGLRAKGTKGGFPPKCAFEPIPGWRWDPPFSTSTACQGYEVELQQWQH